MNKSLIIMTSLALGSTVGVSQAASVSSRPIMVGTATDELNVRSGPSVSYKVITKIKKGASVDVYSKNTNGWYKVKYSGKEGWVNGKYLKEKFISSSPTRYISGVRREVLRDKAATGGNTYGYVYEGESVKVIDYSGSYARVLYKGRVFYISKQYLQTTHKSETRYVSGKAKVELKELSSKTSETKGTIAEGTSVKVVGSKGEYYHVKYKDKWYYTEKKWLSKSNPVSVGFVSGVDSVEVYSEDKKKVLGYIANGQKVTKFTTQNGYTRIKWDSTTSLIKSDSCKFLTYVNKLVNTNSVGIMSEQSKSSKKIGTLSKNQKVAVYDKYEEWSKVKVDGKYGYVQNKYLDEVKYSGVKTGTPLRSSKKSSNDSNIITKIPQGEKVIIESYSNGWSKVKYGSKTGYVLNEDLLVKKPSVNEVKPPVISTVKTKDADVWIRKTPEWSGEKLIVVRKDTKIDLYEKGKEWSKVGYQGSIGYIGNEYLSFGDEEVPTVIGTVKTKDTDVWIRKTPEWSGEKLIIVKKDTKIDLYERGKEWSKVGYQGSIGYIGNEYLSFGDEEVPPVENPPNNEDITTENPGKPETEVGYLDTNKITQPTVSTRYVSNEKINVYRDSSEENLIGYLKKGETIEEIAKVLNGFVKCKINNAIIGYIKEEDISHRNPLAINTERFTVRKVNKTHEEYVATQEGKTYPKLEDIKYYSNPKNFSLQNKDERYQFLKLNTFRNINVYELNEYLNSIAPKGGKETVFKNQAQAFVDAARKNNIDPVYLVAHTMLETGYGFSELAQGVIVEKDGAGNSITPTKVHNLYGIGAVDSDAIGQGSKVAYALGWTDIPKAIEGSAKWISTGVKANPSIGLKEGYGYINSERFNYQYTLYSMRWDWQNAWHQYASDSQWALKISKLMNKLSYLYEGAELVFEEIQYNESKKTLILNEEVPVKDDEITEDIGRGDIEGKNESVNSSPEYNEMEVEGETESFEYEKIIDDPVYLNVEKN